MKAVNLYLLTREVEPDILSDYEYALSGRSKSIKCRTEEIELIKLIVNKLVLRHADSNFYDGWFYSFTIPQIGKEFDLLRIGDKAIVNIELKSQPVELTKVERQLYQNRYYLGHLNKPIYSFTVMRDRGDLQILKYEGGVQPSSFDEIIERVGGEGYCENNIEQLFDPCFYLVSPINTPDRFLGKEYFLNNQQASIKREIMELHPDSCLFGIKGPAGTGKTLLLYDIAFAYGHNKRTCILHSGPLTEGHEYLQRNSENVKIISSESMDRDMLGEFDVICVDETQRLSAARLDMILLAAQCGNIRCIFSYDFSQALSKAEVQRNNPKRLGEVEGFMEFKLSDRIRTNNEIVSFIGTMLRLYDRPKKKMSFDNVDVLYANDAKEANAITGLFMARGYKYITLTPPRWEESSPEGREAYASSYQVIGQEYDRVIVVMDSNFRYNEHGELEGREQADPDYLFARLFYQNVTRARIKLCLVVLDNPGVFRTLIKIKNNKISEAADGSGTDGQAKKET